MNFKQSSYTNAGGGFYDREDDRHSSGGPKLGGRREEDHPGHDRASSQADTKRYLHFWSLSVSQLSVVTLYFV